MKTIYILLAKTGTIPSRFIHTFTRGAFTHASLALTPETDRFYSYGRRVLRNLFNAGLIVEDIHGFVFARYPNCHCALYSLEVSDEAHEKMVQTVQEHLKNYEKATYNFLGVIPLRMGIRIPRKYKLVCSQFVARVLASANEIELPKDPYLMLPNDFLKIQNIQQIYEGPLKSCRFPASNETKPSKN